MFIFLPILVMTREFSYKETRCQVPSLYTEAEDVVTQITLCCSDYCACACICACVYLLRHCRSQNSFHILKTSESSTCVPFFLYSWNLWMKSRTILSVKKCKDSEVENHGADDVDSINRVIYWPHWFYHFTKLHKCGFISCELIK